MNKGNARIIALYLPQYHPFKENDEWWGKGFTEWTNVGRAKPLFKGHYQPRVPADLGYYDLRLPIIREQQAEMAREAGIEGFCYWHYWFGDGKQLMAEIINEVIETGKPDFPFCFGWANHSWYAKNWNTSETKGKDRLLIEQKYLGTEDYRKHYEYVSKAFKDVRYIKEENKPVFMVYSSKDVPEEMIIQWNNWAKEDGFDGIYFMGNISVLEKVEDYKKKGFNALIKNRMEGIMDRRFQNKIYFLYSKIKSHCFGLPDRLFDYKDIIDCFVDEEDVDENLIPNIIPGFDHSPRSGKYGLILRETTPALFYDHCMKVLSLVKRKQNKFVILRSWNEWGEGNYMEPDIVYKKGFLDALHEAVNNQ